MDEESVYIYDGSDRHKDYYINYKGGIATLTRGKIEPPPEIIVCFVGRTVGLYKSNGKVDIDWSDR